MQAKKKLAIKYPKHFSHENVKTCRYTQFACPRSSPACKPFAKIYDERRKQNNRYNLSQIYNGKDFEINNLKIQNLKMKMFQKIGLKDKTNWN